MTTKQTEGQRHALVILADCPEGATQSALLHNAGCSTDALAALVEQGLARVRTAPMANPPGFVVTRYWITDAGLDQQKESIKCTGSSS